jgi:hypothetical protein
LCLKIRQPVVLDEKVHRHGKVLGVDIIVHPGSLSGEYVSHRSYAGREGRSNERSWGEEGRKAAREWRRRQEVGQTK